MSEKELYKVNYMQIPFEISEGTLDELEKHCKKMIDYERGRRGNEHNNVLQLIYNYREKQKEIELKDKVIERMAEDMKETSDELVEEGWYSEFKYCTVDDIKEIYYKEVEEGKNNEKF